jgi:hypothetical protein
MAYRKTAGRSNLVQPTGLPNFSGFKQAAASYGQIGDLAYGIGLDDRKREFNQLIRQAEIDGRTAGVSYDEEGNLVPLTNFDYGKASQTYADADQQQILATYRKAAVQTYVNAAANDINDAASNALIDNPNDPAAIRSNAQGYLQGISDIDEEIYTALAPKVASAFTRVENQALAQQRSDEIEYAVDQGTKAYNQNSVELGVLYAKSAGTTNPAQATALQDRIDEILAEQDDIISTLEANEVSPKSIDAFKDAQATVIASKVAQAGVERAYYSGGASEAYMMIKEAVAEAELNPDINSTTLRNVMAQSVQMLSAIEAAQSKEEKEVRSAIYGDFYRSAVVDGLDIVGELADPSSLIHGLEDTQIANLFSVSTSATAQNSSKIASGYKAQYQNHLAVLDNPTQTTPAMAMDAMREIKLLHGMGLLGLEGDKLLLEAGTKYDEALVLYQGDDIEKQGSMISMELNPNLSSFSKTPAYYRNEMYMSGLESKNIIGKGGYWADREAFITDVNTYAGHHQKRVDLTRLAGVAESKISNTIMPTASELAAFSEVMNFDKIRNNQTGEMIPMDLLSEDEDIFFASVNVVAGFAVQTKGLLHPGAAFLLENAPNNVDNANRSLQLMGQTISAIRKARDIDQEQAEGIFYNSLNEETVAFLRIADSIGVELAVDAFSADKSLNRNASALVANSKYSEVSEDQALESIFMDAYTESLVGRSILDIMQPYITDEDNQMLNQIASNAGVTNVKSMILSDPYIKQGMKSLFLGKMLKYPMYDPVKAMRDTIREMGKRVGAQQNAYTGELEFITNPILPRAQSTTGNAGVTLGMNDINQDIKDLFTSNSGLIDPKILEQLMRVDEAPRVSDLGFPDKFMDTALHYIPNEVYGGRQTYRVVLRTSYGQAIPLLNDYSYDFKRSKGYQSFLQSVETLKSDKMKNFWSSYGLMDQSLLQSGFDSLERTRSDRSFSGLMNIFNSTFRSDIGDELLTGEEKDEFFYMLDRITSLGWR